MTELNLEETGRRVKKIREALNLTKAAFSTKMSLSLNTTLLLEKGEHKCLYDFVYNLSVIFKVNLNYLFYGKGGFFARHSGHPDNHFVPGEPADNYEELLWYLRRSKFMRNAVFEFLSKYLYNNEGFIKKDIEKHKYKRILPKLEHELFDLSLLGDFGKRVRKIREHVKLTQQQFADAIKEFLPRRARRRAKKNSSAKNRKIHKRTKRILISPPRRASGVPRAGRRRRF